MCRMFGMVAPSPVSVREVLHEAPRSLRALSREHADGWGIAFGSRGEWRVHRSTSCAADCSQYGSLADVQAEVVVAHIRKATVGRLAIDNTHPFRRDGVVFAHNGTVHAVPMLIARTSAAQLGRIEGDTDSERLFAFVMTHVDGQGDVERGVSAAVAELRALGDIGSASFLVSCGDRLFGYRCGRTLFTVAHGDVAMIASEPLTAAAWTEVPEGALVMLRTAHAKAPASKAA